MGLRFPTRFYFAFSTQLRPLRTRVGFCARILGRRKRNIKLNDHALNLIAARLNFSCKYSRRLGLILWSMLLGDMIFGGYTGRRIILCMNSYKRCRVGQSFNYQDQAGQRCNSLLDKCLWIRVSSRLSLSVSFLHFGPESPYQAAETTIRKLKFN